MLHEQNVNKNTVDADIDNLLEEQRCNAFAALTCICDSLEASEKDINGLN